ncbi:hypothetical protein POM88_015713 [Heracleum sosnowskyi]|uniref:Uncharacterized protein n=1 Tax=Heracleum sosnowskyi TaxID=360622 RepID=A0AAD8IP80_9APIA|nr:hypothetical protein POM88_015713 [Heracleum sosnowskyi]
MCYMCHRKFLAPDHKWSFDKRRFNGEFEMGQAPPILTGTDVLDLLSGYENEFGNVKKKVKRGTKRKRDSPFKKKSIFFNLPYWGHNLLRQYTWKVLHPIKSSDGKYHEFKAAIFDMTKQEKEIFCPLLEKAKLPYGYAANISRYVHTQERIISGYKSHDAHFVLHYLLQFAVKKTLKPEDVESLLEEHRALIDATKVLKRQFVTIYQLQQQQRTKKCTEVCSPRKSARLNNVLVKIPTEVKRYRKSGEGTEVTSTKKSTRPMSARLEINDMISKQKPKSTEKKGARKSTPINNQASNENVNLKSSSVRRKLDLHNPRDEDENTDENDIQIEYLPPPPPLESSPVKLLTIMEYEMIKLENIRRNNEKLKALNLPTLATEKVDSMKKNNGKRNSRDENAYVPENDDQSGDDASESVSKLPCAEGVGTMANYLVMLERKRKQAANDVVASGTGTKTDKVPETDMPFFENEEVEPAVQAPKKKRGKTRMDKVHTRPFEKRVVILVNIKFQPVADDDQKISELSNFLGTLKRCVPLTYASWEHVPESLKDTFWSYTKQRYIIP